MLNICVCMCVCVMCVYYIYLKHTDDIKFDVVVGFLLKT